MKKQVKLPKLVSTPEELIPMTWQKTMLKGEFKKVNHRKTYDFNVFHSPSICQVILPITTDGKVVFCRQFRHSIAICNGLGQTMHDPCVLELPGGGPEKGERSATAAKRELLEETGYEAGNIVCLAQNIWFDPASTTLRFVPWLAVDCSRVAKPNHDSTESIQVQTVSWLEWIKLIQTGKVTTSHSIVTTMLAMHLLPSRS